MQTAMRTVVIALVGVILWSVYTIVGSRGGSTGTRLVRLLRVWTSVAVIGLLGLLVGILRFPTSNLLGGLALIFAPLWMTAAPITLLLFALWFREQRRVKHTSDMPR